MSITNDTDRRQNVRALGNSGKLVNLPYRCEQIIYHRTCNNSSGCLCLKDVLTICNFMLEYKTLSLV